MRLFSILCLILIGFSCKQPTTNNAATATEPLVLEHLVRPATNNSKKSPVLILLHGLGSNEQDLFKFKKFVDPSWLVISARAPYVVKEGQKFKWYDLTRQKGKWVRNYAQIKESHQILLKFIDQIKTKYNVDEQRIVIGGFSQGAIMSYSIGLLNPEQVAGIVCFSGDIYPEIETKIMDASKYKNLKIFASHGENDPVLPFSDAVNDRKILEELGVNATFVFDQSKHNISGEHIQGFRQFLNGI